MHRNLIKIFIGSALLGGAGVAFAGGGSDAATSDGALTLSAFTFRADDVTSMQSDNALTAFLEDKFNVKFDWDVVPSQESDIVREKLNLLIAADDYPDIIMAGRFNSSEAFKWGLEGVVVPLNDLIDENAPNIQAAFALKPYFEPAITAPDGNIYFIPHFGRMLSLLSTLEAVDPRGLAGEAWLRDAADY
jgi:putative aldouronate transport system substrate-binding protein